MEACLANAAHIQGCALRLTAEFAVNAKPMTINPHAYGRVQLLVELVGMNLRAKVHQGLIGLCQAIEHIGEPVSDMQRAVMVGTCARL